MLNQELTNLRLPVCLNSRLRKGGFGNEFDTALVNLQNYTK
jgi:hypothetical protein